MNPETLAKEPETEFSNLVKEDLRQGLDSETSQMLRDPKVVLRWRNSLRGIRQSVENQLVTRRADIETGHLTVEDFNEWRPAALRFRGGVFDRLTEAESVIIMENLDMGNQSSYHDDWLNLVRAIEEHRDHLCDKQCSENCMADEVLWSNIA